MLGLTPFFAVGVAVGLCVLRRFSPFLPSSFPLLSSVDFRLSLYQNARALSLYLLAGIMMRGMVVVCGGRCIYMCVCGVRCVSGSGW